MQNSLKLAGMGLTMMMCACTHQGAPKETQNEGFSQQNFIEAFGKNPYITTEDYKNTVDKAIKLNGIQADTYGKAKESLDSTYNAYVRKQDYYRRNATTVLDRMNRHEDELRKQLNSDITYNQIKKNVESYGEKCKKIDSLEQAIIDNYKERAAEAAKNEAMRLKAQGFTDKEINEIQMKQLNEVNRMDLLSRVKL